MPGHVIQTEGLTRRFDEVLAVDDLSVEVAPGEIFGFLGPNGAGKTTTMRMLSALIGPSAGEASVCGHDIRRDPDGVRASVGILTETPGLYDKLTADQNLRLHADLHGVHNAQGQISKYLTLLDLWDRRHDLAGTYSKGMRQKLALARALLHEPPVLFLDEPTSALDPASARVVRDCVAELRGAGRTIFLCTHNLSEAEELCDRIAIFRGRLLRLDTLEGLRQDYGHAARVRLRGLDPALVARVEELPFVTSVTAGPEANELRVSLQRPEADNPQLIRALVEAGAEVLWVEEERQSLERVYLDLIEAHDGDGDVDVDVDGDGDGEASP